MTAEFEDRFGSQAASYAVARPTYPPELFSFLASESPARGCAWDCATGNGQAAVAVAEHFEHVIATDASEAQLAQAEPHPRVSYRIARAEESGLEDASVDLVTVAQALHWFDRDSFFREVDRVLKPGGLLAVWTYALHTISPDVDREVQGLYDGAVGPYWTPNRSLVVKGYASIRFPYEPVAAPAFQMEARWTLDRLVGYLRSWSASAAYVREHGEDPVPVEALAQAWGAVEEREVQWPLTVYVRRKPL